MATGTEGSYRFAERLGPFSAIGTSSRTHVAQTMRVLRNDPDELFTRDVSGRSRNKPQMTASHAVNMVLAVMMARGHASAPDTVRQFRSLRLVDEAGETGEAELVRIMGAETLGETLDKIVENFPAIRKEWGNIRVLLMDRNGYPAAVLMAPASNDHLNCARSEFVSPRMPDGKAIVRGDLLPLMRMCEITTEVFEFLFELWADGQTQLGLSSGSVPASAVSGEGENADLPARRSA